MGTDWLKEAADVRAEIKDEGIEGLLFIETMGAYNVATGKKEAIVLDENKFEVFCLIKSFDQVDHENILPTDLNVMVVSQSSTAPYFHMLKNLSLTITDVGTYDVLNISPVMPAGVPLLYNLHCRQ